MITKTDMLDSMLVACPSFRPAWDAFLAEWSTEDDKPLYLALGGLARHLLDLLAARQESELSGALSFPLDTFPDMIEEIERARELASSV